MDESKRYLRTGKAAKILGVAEATLRRWAEEDKLPCFHTPSGQLRFDVSSIVNKTPVEKHVVLYARVSSAKQRDDLQRQQQYLR
jgi:predicted site-specific integrase-resolvase